MREPIRVVPIARTLTGDKKLTQKPGPRSPAVWPVRPAKLLWVPIVGGLWLSYTAFGSPHLRFAYNWSGNPDSPTFNWCDYVGQHSRRIYPNGEHCPLIRFLRDGAE